MFSSSFWKGRVHVRLCVLCCLRRFCCVCVCYLVSECFTELRFHALFQALPEWGGYFGSEWHQFRVILHVSLHTFLHFFLPLCSIHLFVKMHCIHMHSLHTATVWCALPLWQYAPYSQWKHDWADKCAVICGTCLTLTERLQLTAFMQKTTTIIMLCKI